jgi:hypothetical protein
VLRRDTKVMLVDVAQLPGTFGNPPSPRADRRTPDHEGRC